MSLSATQFARLEAILQAIEPARKKMNPNAQNFVADQIKRVEEWGEDIRLSPKQWQWLEKLYEQFGAGDGALPDADEGDPLADVPDTGEGVWDPADDGIRADENPRRPDIGVQSSKGPRKATKAVTKSRRDDDDIPF